MAVIDTSSRRRPNLHPVFMMLPVALAVLALDQATKAWVTATLISHNTLEIIPGFARLRYTENTGAAFGLFQGFKDLLSLVAVLIIGAIVLSASRMAGRGSGRGSGKGDPQGDIEESRHASNNALLLVTLGLVLGGAVGNLADRLRLGFVVDFIEVYGPRLQIGRMVYTWPVFNIADSAISVGVVLIMAGLLFAGKREAGAARREVNET